MDQEEESICPTCPCCEKPLVDILDYPFAKVKGIEFQPDPEYLYDQFLEFSIPKHKRFLGLFRYSNPEFQRLITTHNLHPGVTTSTTDSIYFLDDNSETILKLENLLKYFTAARSANKVAEELEFLKGLEGKTVKTMELLHRVKRVPLEKKYCDEKIHTHLLYSSSYSDIELAINMLCSYFSIRQPIATISCEGQLNTPVSKLQLNVPDFEV